MSKPNESKKSNRWNKNQCACPKEYTKCVQIFNNFQALKFTGSNLLNFFIENWFPI